MHVDKLMPYYPDFGEELHSWIETDHPIRYRDQEEQTTRPALQSQLTAVVDIPPQISDPTPDPEPEMIEVNTAESPETETPLAVLDTRLDSTAHPEPSVGPSAILET